MSAPEPVNARAFCDEHCGRSRSACRKCRREPGIHPSWMAGRHDYFKSKEKVRAEADAELVGRLERIGRRLESVASDLSQAMTEWRKLVKP